MTPNDTSSSSSLTERERFLAAMEYRPVDRVPNHEAGVWPQTMDRWHDEGLNRFSLNWDWFTGCEYFGMDSREFIPINFGMMPAYEEEIYEETDRYITYRHTNGIVTKALKEGTSRGGRMSMDTYLDFPVKNLDDFREIKKRYEPDLQGRYPAHWRTIMLPRWKQRQHVLVLGVNCSTLGFYWRARAGLALADAEAAAKDLKQCLVVHPGFDPCIQELLKMGIEPPPTPVIGETSYTRP